MKHTKFLAGVVSMVCAAALSACAASDTGGDGGDGELRIAATTVDSLPFMALLQVADQKGWFEEEGIDVSFISGSGGGNTLRTLSTGDADMAIAGGPAVVQAAQKSNGGIKIIAPWFQINDFHWIAPKDAAVEPANASLGVTGAGSTTQLLAQYVKNEEMPGTEVVELGGGMGDSWAAARSGTIDAGWAMHPFVTDKIQNEGATIVFSARDLIGDFPADIVATTSDYAEGHSEELKAFFRVAERANQYIVANTAEAAKELSPILGIENVEMLATALRDTPEMKKAYSLKVDKDALQTLSDMMQSNNLIDEPVDWSEMLDQSYLPEDARAEY